MSASFHHPFGRSGRGSRRFLRNLPGVFLILSLVGLAPAAGLFAAPLPSDLHPEAKETMRYTGAMQPDAAHYDGKLPHVLGVHSMQVFRANRSRPPEGGGLGYTYNHGQFLAYWKGNYYVQFLQGIHSEHAAPTRTVVLSSSDGLHWTPPRIVFPVYDLPAFKLQGKIIPAGLGTVMHQRMGFYVAPNGRLLTSGFYGYVIPPGHMPDPDHAVARVVREIKADGSFGPVYVIRYPVRDTGFTAANIRWPSYRDSEDPGFVAACDALLANKLFTLQWYEENRGDDGFFPISEKEMGKGGRAATWFTRKDGRIVAIWKSRYSALSADGGKTWGPVVQNRTLMTADAKTWGQHTSDERYALVYNHTLGRRNRFPLAVMTSDDGEQFDSLYCLQGEVPPMRYSGLYKNAGPQYIRGISEGNGTPPNQDLWLTYSMNKEDIWVSRVIVPIADRETQPVDEDFEGADPLRRWNLYLPQWAPTRIVVEPGTGNHVMELRDEDPADYAKAERLFPAAAKAVVHLRIQGRQVPHDGVLAIEVQTQRHDRPVCLYLKDEWLYVAHTRRSMKTPFALQYRRWYDIALLFNCDAQTYTLEIDGEVIHRDVEFSEPAETLSRVVFRTGAWRGLAPAEAWDRDHDMPLGLQQDMPGVDAPADPTEWWIDDLSVK